MKLMSRIEPSYAAWEAAVLPLNYTRDARRFYADYRRYSNNSALTVKKQCGLHCWRILVEG